MKNVIGHFVPVGLSDSSEDYEFCMCIPESHGTLTGLLIVGGLDDYKI
jgi:hypothetical protein